MEEHRKELNLVGIFKTISEGKDPGSPNAFLFPLPNGGWRVFRFSPGINEADTWTQSDDGWTTCYFNRYFNRFPTLASAAKQHNGIEEEGGGFVFTDAAEAGKAADALGQKLDLKLDLDPTGGPRKITLKSHKDGRLVVQVERKKADVDLPGWLDKKGKWVRIFDTQTDTTDEPEESVAKYDSVVRCLVSATKEHAGWVTSLDSHDSLWA